MTRPKIAAGNWKMNLDLEPGVALAQAVCQGDIPEDVTVILAPPFLHLHALSRITGDHPRCLLAAQNCHQEDSGAYTGEISPAMLHAMGIDYVILGHSERRQYFGETDALLLEKVRAALKNQLKIIFCCGEPLDIREKGQHQAFVQRQLEASIFQLNPEAFSRITIAYEPIWAIGTGVTASPEQAQEMHAFIRQGTSDRYDDTMAQSTPILYGGSVKPGNAQAIFSQRDVDGGLVGGASLKADDFLQIANSF